MDEIDDAYDCVIDEGINNGLDYQDNENPQANLFNFTENQDQNQDIFHKEIIINCSEIDEDSTGDLKLSSLLIKNEENENVVQTEIKGSGQIQEIIELGCASYTNAIEFAKQEVMKIDSNANQMMVNLQLSQKAAQLMMKYQLGDAGVLFENMFPGLFNSFLGDESEDNKD